MKYSLLEAINKIAKIEGIDPNRITSIQYEDGSGKCFNVEIDYKAKFVRLS